MVYKWYILPIGWVYITYHLFKGTRNNFWYKASYNLHLPIYFGPFKGIFDSIYNDRRGPPGMKKFLYNIHPGKLTCWTPKMDGWFGSDDFQDFNWVIFRFHENFQGLQGPKKVRYGAYCMAQMSWNMNSQKRIMLYNVWWFLYKTYCSNQPTLRVFQQKMYPKDVFFRILATSLQNGEI